MLTTAALLLLTAAPLKVAATGFTVTGDDASKANVWLERFAEVMRRDKRIEVTTTSDIAQLLGVERQKQLLGCDAESASCMTELASALGADGLLVGSITRTGDSYLAVVKVIRQKNGAVWWSASSRMKGEGALLDWLDEQAEEAVKVLIPPPEVRLAPLLTGAGSIVALGVGATLVALSNTVGVQRVRNADSEMDIATAVQAGQFQNVAGISILAVAGAGLAASIIWLALPGPAKTTVVLAPSPEGGFALVGGRW